MVFEAVSRAPAAHEDAVWGVGWQNNDTLFSGGADERVVKWNVKADGLENVAVSTGHLWGLVSLAVDGERCNLVSSSIDSTIRVVNTSDMTLTRSIKASPVETWGVALSPNGEHIASSSRSGNINIWSMQSGDKLQVYEPANDKFSYSVDYSPDNRLLASGAADGIVSVFDIETGKRKFSLEGHAMAVRSLRFTPDAATLLSASNDKHVNLFDLRSGELIASASGHASWVVAVDISADGRHFVTGSSDATMRVWEMNTRQCVQTFEAHTDAVWCVKFSPDGLKIASGGNDKTVALYNTCAK